MSMVLIPHFQSQINSKAKAFTQAFLKNSLQHNTRHDLTTMLSYKAVILSYARTKKDKLKRNSKKAKGLNAQQKRTMKIFQIKPEHQRLVRILKPHKGESNALMCNPDSKRCFVKHTLNHNAIICNLKFTDKGFTKCP